MPMQYVPKMPQLKERICAYGQGGAGKSKITIDMMRRMTDRHFHILDIDAAYEFSIYEDDERNKKIIAAENFTLHTPDPHDWEEHKAALGAIEANAQPGDWAVFDSLDPLWESVTGWYTKVFLGLDEDDYKARVRMALEEKRQEQLEEKKKQDRTAPLFDQLRDYQYINPEYKRHVYDLFVRLNSRGVHVLCMADTKPVSDQDDIAIRKRYRAYRERPASQKGLTKAVNTVLHLAYDGEESWTMSTTKDRGSRTLSRLDEEEWSDFCTTYLSPIAGWHMEKVDD